MHESITLDITFFLIRKRQMYVMTCIAGLIIRQPWVVLELFDKGMQVQRRRKAWEGKNKWTIETNSHPQINENISFVQSGHQL